MPAPITEELGVAGVSTSYGEIRDPSGADLDLEGERGRLTFRRMRDDPTCGAIIGAVEGVLRAVPWHVDPADESVEAADAADFVGSVLFEDMSHSWQDAVGDALTMATYGWSVLELVWKRRLGPDQSDPSRRSMFSDGRFGLRKAVGRDQLTLSRWEFDEGGGVSAMVQRDHDQGREIILPIERILLFRTSRERGSPEGRSLLRAAHVPWQRRRHLEIIEGIGIERSLAGLPVVFGPPEVMGAGGPRGPDDPPPDPKNVAKLQALMKVARDLRLNEQGALGFSSECYRNEDRSYTNIPKWGIKLLGIDGAGKPDQSPVIQRYDGQIARSAQTDFILLGSQKIGSFALSKSKIELFLLGLEWLADVIADTFQRHCIPKILGFNGIDPRLEPNLRHGDVAPADLAELADYLRALAAVGVPVTDEPGVNYLRAAGGLPELTEEMARAEAEAEAALAAGTGGAGDEAEAQEEAAGAAA